MSTRDTINEAICEAIDVPAHIAAAASACRFDLMNGPSWSRIPGNDITKFTHDDYEVLREYLEDDCEPGDVITETYTGPVGKALRAFIEDLPSSGYVDVECGGFQIAEPEGYYDDGERIEPNWEDFCEVDCKAIVRALFGETIAREFN